MIESPTVIVDPSVLPPLANTTIGEGGSSGVRSGGGDSCNSGEFVCSCEKRFHFQSALRRHQRRTRCAPAQLDACEPCEDANEDACQAITERDIDNIAEGFLDECTELRYEQYISPANVQRVKDLVTRVTAQQTAAIKRAIAPHLIGSETNLDDLIDPIMQATDRYRTQQRELSGRQRRQTYRVHPMRRSLGTHPIEHDVGGGRMETRNEELYMYDIPIEQSLQREVLYNPDFAKHFRDWGVRPPNADGSYTSTQDGSVARNHPMLGNTTYEGPSRLAFAHYYDDVEVVNPLGAARTKHKLGLHYVQLLNPPPHVRSDLDVIFLASVVLKTTQDTVGVSEVVQGAQNEARDGTSLGASLRRFDQETGIQFRMPDQSTQSFRGWLLLVAADTLAAAELIGFKKGFGPQTKSPCWQCDAGGGESLRCACSFHGQGQCPFTLRTPGEYRNQRRHAKTMSSAARSQFQDSIGVNTYRHAYTRIPYFDVISNVPRDLMHVELEGNLKVHLYGFLYMATVKYKWFSRAQLNARIKAFPFCSKVRRPPDIPASALKGRKGTLPQRKGTIPYTSGHMLHFVLHSLEILRPLLRRHPSSFDSAEYKAWVAHVRYFAALVKRSFTDQSIAALDAMIYHAHSLFLKIAAYSQLWKPKNHFAQHIPGDIQRFGPPRTYWCMRFEAKNQDHKKAANTGNFKNVAQTVATFWAERSAHRLNKKRARTATEQTGTFCLDGMELTVGTWVLFKRPEPAKAILAKIHSIAYCEDGTVRGLNVESFDLDSVLRDDGEGGMCAEVEALENGQHIVIPLVPGCMSELLAVMHDSHVWFVEQP